MNVSIIKKLIIFAFLTYADRKEIVEFGHAVYIVLTLKFQPLKILFGFSFDDPLT